MSLVLLISILVLGGVIAWIAGKINSSLPKYIALASIVATFVVACNMWGLLSVNASDLSIWKANYSHPWISLYGINFHLALDGFGYIMILLTLFLGLIAIILSWCSIDKKTGFYFFNLLFMLAGIVGIFLAVDLFLFYFFWEVMLIPLYFIMLIWGYEGNKKASFKFLLYTQASGLLMLIAILGLHFIHGKSSLSYTFELEYLLGTYITPIAGTLLFLGFIAAFFVKLAIVPFHGWLPDAFQSSPVAVNITGLLIKTGALGILRFAIPLFPEAATNLSIIFMAIGVVGIVYGAFMAFSQTNLFRLIAYSTISHMGFIVLGLFSFNEIAFYGVVVQMVASALSTSALLIIASSIVKKTGTADLTALGGMWTKTPVLSGLTLVFTMATLGLPGSINFVAEFLILAGSFKSNILLTSIAGIGLVAAAIYSLRMLQRIVYGKSESEGIIPEISLVRKTILGVLIVLVIGFGLYPKPIIDKVKPTIENILNIKR
jgi:NADH-quinone oxidoreductase subunit M